MTTQEANVKTIREFFRLAQLPDGDVLAIMADDATWWVPGSWALSGTYSKTEIGNLFGQVFSMLASRPQFTIHSITAQDDRVAVDASSTGRFLDDSPFGNSYHFLFTLRDGLIASAKEFMDTDYMATLLTSRPDMVQ